ncbi:MAG: PucR family transcriptional regulator [Oscillospiraceae bacterium]
MAADLLSKVFDYVMNDDIQGVMDIFYQETGCPVNYVDVLLHPLAFAPKERIGDYVWDEILKSKLIPVDVLSALNQKDLINTCYEAKRPVLLNEELVNGPKRMLMTVQQGNEVLGYVTIYIVKESLEHDLDYYRNILIQLSKITALILKNNGTEKQNLSNINSVFISYLTSNNINNERELDMWKTVINMDLRRKHCFICVTVPRHKDRSILQYIAEQTGGTDILHNSVIEEDCLYFFVNGIQDKDGFYKYVKKRFSEFFEFNIKIGVSNIFDDLFLSGYYKQQARLVSSYSAKEKISFFDDCVPGELIKELKNSEKIKQWIHPIFDDLKKYDSIHNTEYFSTLVSYIKNLGCTQKIISDLNIHRNTLPARIDFIEHKMGYNIDLKSFNDFFALAASVICLTDMHNAHRS